MLSHSLIYQSICCFAGCSTFQKNWGCRDFTGPVPPSLFI